MIFPVGFGAAVGTAVGTTATVVGGSVGTRVGGTAGAEVTLTGGSVGAVVGAWVAGVPHAVKIKVKMINPAKILNTFVFIFSSSYLFAKAIFLKMCGFFMSESFKTMFLEGLIQAF